MGRKRNILIDEEQRIYRAVTIAEYSNLFEERAKQVLDIYQFFSVRDPSITNSIINYDKARNQMGYIYRSSIKINEFANFRGYNDEKDLVIEGFKNNCNINIIIGLANVCQKKFDEQEIGQLIDSEFEELKKRANKLQNLNQFSTQNYIDSNLLPGKGQFRPDYRSKIY